MNRVEGNDLGSERARWPAGWGAVAGLVAGVPVGTLMAVQGMVTPHAWGLTFLYWAAVGMAIGLILAYRPRGLAVAASGGVMIGLLGWLLVALTVEPVLRGQAPTWSAAAAAVAYPELVAGLLHGGLTGAVLYGLLSAVARWTQSGSVPAAAPPLELTRFRGHLVTADMVMPQGFR